MSARPLSRLSVVALCALLSPLAAHAGSASASSHSLSVVISDGGGNSWDLGDELTAMLSFNAATGDVSLVPPSQTVSDADGTWTPGTTVTLGNGQTVSGLGWHSAQSVNGVWAATLLVTHVGGNVDPSMDYGFYFKNNSASTQTYTVNYGESIDPLVTGAYAVTASLAGATTNTDGSTTVGPALTSADGLIQQLQLSSDNGTTLVNAGVDVGPGVTQGGTATYGPYSAMASGVAPASGYNYWNFHTVFTLTGNKDVFVANGEATITAVPEPQSLALLVTSLVLIGSTMWPRRDD